MINIEEDVSSIISTVHFGLLSEEEKESLAACIVTSPQINNACGMPNDNGVMSLYMGSTTSCIYCKTCQKKGSECSGHFGLLKLAKPLYNPLTFGQLKKALGMVCFWCSTSLLTKHTDKIRGKGKFAVARKAWKRAMKSSHHRTCPECNGIQPEYTTQQHRCLAVFDDDVLNTEFEKGNITEDELVYIRLHSGRNFSQQKAFEILRDVEPSFWKDTLHFQSSLDTCFILSSLLIPPTNIRPPFYMNDKQKQHDTTKMLQTCVRLNDGLRAHVRKKRPEQAKKVWSLLQQQVNQYLVKDYGGGNKRTGPQSTNTTSVLMSFQGKGGLIRKNLLGKRTTSNGRTVIGGDPTVDVGTVVVPSKMCKVLTVPQRCTPLNRSDLLQCIAKGAHTLGGAEFIVKLDGRKKSCNNLTPKKIQYLSTHLEVGDVVHRHLRDDDYLLFNRAPTLTKMSILGHRVKVDPSNNLTIRFNQLSCGTFNADFDGDEMTINIPQTLPACAELKHLVNICENTLDAANSTSVFEPVQDICSSVYSMTSESSFIRKDQLMQLSMHLVYNESQRSRILSLYTTDDSIDSVPARTLLELLFPTDLTFRYKNKLLVRSGLLVEQAYGVKWTNKMLGSLFRRLTLDYGHRVCCDLCSDLCRISTAYLTIYRGLSVGLRDFYVPESSRRDIACRIDEIVDRAETFSTDAEQMLALSEAASVFKMCGKKSVMQQDPMCGMSTMVHSGAKGKEFNIQQLLGCLGQQVINGKRPMKLPCFSPDDASPDAKGFVKNNYSTGMNPIEMFFHQCAGRDGLIDTSIKTAESGYTQRKLDKSMEDVCCRTLQNGRVGVCARNRVLTTSPGFSPEYLETVRVDLNATCTIPRREELRLQLLNNFRKFNGSSPFCLPSFSDTELGVPLDVQTLFESLSVNSCGDSVQLACVEKCLHVQEAELRICRFVASLSRFGPTDALEYCLLGLIDGTDTDGRIRQDVLEQVLNKTERCFHRCLFVNGDPIGGLAAGFCSRDTTQSTLDSFHSSGQELVSGIKRTRHLTELMSGIQTMIRIMPRDIHLRKDKLAMQLVAARLSCVHFRQLLSTQRRYVITEDPASVGVQPIPMEEPFDGDVWWYFIGWLDVEVVRKAQLSSVDICRRIVEVTNLTMCWISAFSEIDDSCNASAKDVLHLQAPCIVMRIRKGGSIADTLEDAENTVIRQLLPITFGESSILSCSVQASKSSSTRKQEYFFQIICTNLDDIVQKADLETETMWCNNPLEVYRHFGLEMAVQVLVRELSQNSGSVDRRWFQIIALLMLHSGHPLPITSHGMAKSFQTRDVLATASFERPRQVFCNAALFGETSSTKNASAAAILSVAPQTGTAIVNIIRDRKTERQAGIQQERLAQRLSHRLAGSTDPTNTTNEQEPVVLAHLPSLPDTSSHTIKYLSNLLPGTSGNKSLLDRFFEFNREYWTTHKTKLQLEKERKEKERKEKDRNELRKKKARLQEHAENAAEEAYQKRRQQNKTLDTAAARVLEEGKEHVNTMRNAKRKRRVMEIRKKKAIQKHVQKQKEKFHTADTAADTSTLNRKSKNKKKTRRSTKLFGRAISTAKYGTHQRNTGPKEKEKKEKQNGLFANVLGVDAAIQQANDEYDLHFSQAVFDST